jgi:methylglutaconyl-CoA hydratase
MAHVNHLSYEIIDQVLWIGLNRTDKHNAFNDELIISLQQVILMGLDNPEVKAFCLFAHGRIFSAGADLEWMRAANEMNEAENIAQAQRLATLLQLWYQSPKPTLCLVQGNAFGGALGFMAASDFCLASFDTQFCFSELKLGLIPAIISPYILETIGLKQTKKLFLSAETFDASQAYHYGLIDEIVSKEILNTQAKAILKSWTNHPQYALNSVKPWLQQIQHQQIDDQLSAKTAQQLAKMRVTRDAKERLNAFLAQKTRKV